MPLIFEDLHSERRFQSYIIIIGTAACFIDCAASHCSMNPVERRFALSQVPNTKDPQSKRWMEIGLQINRSWRFVIWHADGMNLLLVQDRLQSKFQRARGPSDLKSQRTILYECMLVLCDVRVDRMDALCSRADSPSSCKRRRIGCCCCASRE